MKYRIIEVITGNNKVYRVQYKKWYWPFWSYFTTGYTDWIKDFDTLKEAKDMIRMWQDADLTKYNVIEIVPRTPTLEDIRENMVISKKTYDILNRNRYLLCCIFNNCDGLEKLDGYTNAYREYLKMYPDEQDDLGKLEK